MLATSKISQKFGHFEPNLCCECFPKTVEPERVRSRWRITAQRKDYSEGKIPLLGRYYLLIIWCFSEVRQRFHTFDVPTQEIKCLEEEISCLCSESLIATTVVSFRVRNVKRPKPCTRLWAPSQGRPNFHYKAAKLLAEVVRLKEKLTRAVYFWNNLKHFNIVRAHLF
jgi:hypothetical protein